MSERETPQINAGSMADIAFLLLIFFLVTTTIESDTGILKRLPDKQQNPPRAEVNERNVLEILINPNDEVLVENSQQLKIDDLKQTVVDFIDNGAKTDAKGNNCDWCHGKKDENSSDHPTKAVIELRSSRSTSYGTYVKVQDEINSAYSDLRNKLSMSLYGISFNELENQYKENKNNKVLKERVQTIKSKYPQLIAEKEPVK